MTPQIFSCRQLPNCNDYIGACRSSKYAGSRMKADAQMLVALGISRARLKSVAGPVRLVFRWIEQDRRRDPDNVAFAKKFILDTLKPFHPKQNPYGMDILSGDGWSVVTGWTDEFAIDKKNPRIEVTIEEVLA